MFNSYEVIRFMCQPQYNFSIFTGTSNRVGQIHDSVVELIEFLTSFGYEVTSHSVNERLYSISHDWYLDHEIHVQLSISKLVYNTHVLKCYMKLEKYKNAIIMLKLAHCSSVLRIKG